MQIVRRLNFVGVAAEREWDAVRAARQLKVTWEPFAAVLPGHEGLSDSFRKATTNDDRRLQQRATPAPRSTSRVPVVAQPPIEDRTESHGTMAPNCALADVRADGALVMCSRRESFRSRDDRGAAHWACLPTRSACSTTLARTRTASSCYTRRRGSGCDHVARTRQTRSPAVEPPGRVRLGQLRPRASRRHARRRSTPTARSSLSTTRRGAYDGMALDTASRLRRLVRPVARRRRSPRRAAVSVAGSRPCPRWKLRRRALQIRISQNGHVRRAESAADLNHGVDRRADT